MRSRWQAVHSSLVRSMSGLAAAREFEGVRARAAVLGRFSDPMTLVRYLASSEGDLDDKDRIIWSLIDEVRFGTAPRLAHSVLLLGFWRALDAIFVRRLGLFRGQGGDLGADLLGRFTIQLRRLDAGRVKRVAATLVRNTERDVVVQRRRELARAAQTIEVTPDVAGAAPVEPEASPFDEPAERTEEGTIRSLRAWLERVTGRDAGAIVDVVILGCETIEVAARLGISRKTLNKRVERALARARRSLNVDSVSPGAITVALVST